MIIEGRVWTCGDHVDTDAIIPARYLNVSNAAELAGHCLEDFDPAFSRAASKDDGVKIIVAGENFGCGSSREHAPLAIKEAGVLCVVAKSFARIFYRNAINIGLPILISPEAVSGTTAGDRLRIDLQTGAVTNLSAGKTFDTSSFPSFILDIIEAGGLVAYTRDRNWT